MTIIQFFKIVFGVSKKEPQDLTQQSNLDIANAQPAPEEYVSSEVDSLSPIEELATSETADIPTPDTQEPVSESINSSEETTSELQEFVNEIDNEYSADKSKSDDSITVNGKIKDDESEQQAKTTSLLDNSPYMSLADSCCDLVKELEKLKTEENQKLVEQVISRIQECLISSGAEPIAEEPAYDVIRHTAVGKSIVRKGTPITATIEPGVAISDKVMIKAKVQI